MDFQRVDVESVPGVDLQVGLLLAVLDDTTSKWRKQLGDVPVEVITWQPFAGGHSIGAVLLHIADVEAHWIHRIGAGQTRSPEELKTLLSEETDQFAVHWPMPPTHPLSWYLAQQDAVRVRTRQFVLELGDPDYLARHTNNKAYTLRWLLTNVISHEAYHGGQAVLLSLFPHH
jgi:uncharacterized damage-inducible protein DinB